MMSALAMVANLSSASFLRRSDRLLDAVREGRPREPFRSVLRRRPVRHHHHRCARGVVVAPAVGLVEEPTAGDQRAATGREVVQHRGACGVDREAHARLCAGYHHVAIPVPIEQLPGVVVGLGDEAVQRHAHVSQHLGHARMTRLAPPIHRSNDEDLLVVEAKRRCAPAWAVRSGCGSGGTRHRCRTGVPAAARTGPGRH